MRVYWMINPFRKYALGAYNTPAVLFRERRCTRATAVAESDVGHTKVVVWRPNPAMTMRGDLRRRANADRRRGGTDGTQCVDHQIRPGVCRRPPEPPRHGPLAPPKFTPERGPPARQRRGEHLHPRSSRSVLILGHSVPGLSPRPGASLTVRSILRFKPCSACSKASSIPSGRTTSRCRRRRSWDSIGATRARSGRRCSR